MDFLGLDGYPIAEQCCVLVCLHPNTMGVCMCLCEFAPEVKKEMRSVLQQEASMVV